MPLTSFDLRDHLVSEQLHMLDVALGLSRPGHRVQRDHATRFGGSPRLTRQSPVQDILLLGDDAEHEADEQPVALALRLRTAGTVDDYRATQEHDAKPIMTAEDRDMREAMIGALVLPRWADGAAYGVSAEYAQRLDVLVEQGRSSYDVLVEEEVPLSLSDEDRASLVREARSACRPIAPEHVMHSSHGYLEAFLRIQTLPDGHQLRHSLWLYDRDCELLAVTKPWLVSRGLWSLFSAKWAHASALRKRARRSLATRSDDYAVKGGKLVRGSVILDPDWLGREARPALRSAQQMRPHGKPDRVTEMERDRWRRAYMPWHHQIHRYVVADDGTRFIQTGWVRRDRWVAGKLVKGGERWVKVPGAAAHVRPVPARWVWNSDGRLHRLPAGGVKVPAGRERWQKEVKYTVKPAHLGGLRRLIPLGTPSEDPRPRPMERWLSFYTNRHGVRRVYEVTKALRVGELPPRYVPHAKGTRTSWVGKCRLHAGAHCVVVVTHHGPRASARHGVPSWHRAPAVRDGQRNLTVLAVEIDRADAFAQHEPHQGPPRDLIGPTTAPTGVDAGQGARTRATRAALNI